MALECQNQIDFSESVEDIRFESVQPEIVSVDDKGMLTALTVGTADITVSLGDEDTYTFEVVVRTPEISDRTITNVVSNCSINGVTVIESDSYSEIRSNTSTFYESKLPSEIGGKIVDAAEDEAISFAVGLVFKLIF